MEELRKQLAGFIAQSDNYMCSRIVGEMLQALEPRDALQIALNQVDVYLPAFEKLHPEESWVRRWLEVSSRFEPINYAVDGGFGFWDSPVEDFESKAYVYGLSLLDGAFRAFFQHQQVVVFDLTENAMDAITNARLGTYLWEKAPILMSKIQDHYRSSPELPSEEDAKVFRDFRELPERRYIIGKLWNEIADEIASKLAL